MKSSYMHVVVAVVLVVVVVVVVASGNVVCYSNSRGGVRTTYY